MKRLSFAIILASLTLSMAAQSTFRVKYQGTKPTISDFITAFLAPTYGEDGEEDESMNGIRYAWEWTGNGFQLTESKEPVSAKNPDDIDYSSGPEYNQDLRSLVNGEE